ncbi:prepilin peptidase [Acidicapsa dinghuensis]|uniref:Prepilin peptidase n=1 Tax=Acidicapsa dinghuensis TaxID=2218256 RepID=A0ABW1ELF0_9BACT|nr:A24 family peptidase [Acidicapsa dinghuensis]
MGTHAFAWWPTVAALAVATFTDLRSRRIPNWLVFPFLALGFIAPAVANGWHSLTQSLEGFALGILVYGALAIFGGMGMGDVKLVAAIGAWVGPRQLLFAMVLTAVVGGLMALGTLAFHKYRNWRQQKQLISELDGGAPDQSIVNDPFRQKIPYAPAIAVGTLLSFFSR